MLCHYGNVECFKLEDKVTVYGGGILKGAMPRSGMMVLDLACECSTGPIVSFVGCTPPKKLANLAHPDIKLVRFDWEDFSVPMLGQEFWLELVLWLKAENRPVLVCCAGGHGRTGTTLAILASLSGVTKGDPIKFIRRVYCENAVETNEQIKYVEAITGKPTKCLPSSFINEKLFKWEDKK